MSSKNVTHLERGNQDDGKLPSSWRTHTVNAGLATCAMLIAGLSGCAEVRKDQDFARSFLVRLKAGDSSIAADMDSTLLEQAGSWQVVETGIQARLPAGAIDSIKFVSQETSSSLPPSMRIVTFNVFGGRQYSAVAQVYVETAASGKPLVNTISVQGPLLRP